MPEEVDVQVGIRQRLQGGPVRLRARPLRRQEEPARRARERVDPKRSATTGHKQGKGFAFASATWQFSTDQLPAEDRGDFFSVSRQFFKRELQRQGVRAAAPRRGHPGERQAMRSRCTSRCAASTRPSTSTCAIPRGAGFEPESQVSSFKWDLGLAWYEEVRDSGENFFFEAAPGRRVHLQVPPAGQPRRNVPRGSRHRAVDVRPRIQRLLQGYGAQGGAVAALRASGASAAQLHCPLAWQLPLQQAVPEVQAAPLARQQS